MSERVDEDVRGLTELTDSSGVFVHIRLDSIDKWKRFMDDIKRETTEMSGMLLKLELAVLDTAAFK